MILPGVSRSMMCQSMDRRPGAVPFMHLFELRFVRVGAECDPHGVANARNRPRRRRACRLRLLRAAIARDGIGLQEQSRDARRGWCAGVNGGAVGRRERGGVRRAARDAGDSARLDRGREPRRASLLSAVAGTGSEFLPGIRSGRSAGVGRARASSGQRSTSAFVSSHSTIQSCPVRRHRGSC